MDKHYLNIDKVTQIETLFNAGWLFKDMKKNEIVLETSELEFSSVRLKATFITLCEGIFNSGHRRPDDPKVEINYDEFEFSDLKTMAQALTDVTGIRFSTALVF